MPRVRTIKAVAEYCKENDPDTCISEFVIRRLIRQGKIPASKSGNRYLVSVEAVESFFMGTNLANEKRAETLKSNKRRRTSFTPIV